MQGQSIAVDLGLAPAVPPVSLFHGTATRFAETIQRHGRELGDRQRVHLSSTEAAALFVGARHRKPLVPRIRALEMHARGSVFHLSKHHVWLTRTVPVEFAGFPAEDSAS